MRGASENLFRPAALMIGLIAGSSAAVVPAPAADSRAVQMLNPAIHSTLFEYGLHNANAADTTNAEDLWPGGSAGLNLSGAGVVVGVWDGGSIRDTHQEFLPGSITNNNAVAISNHATHVAGTIVAQGVHAPARGMASGATIQGWDFDNDTTEMAASAASLHLSNHSYGQVRGWRSDAYAGTSLGVRDWWFADYSIGGAAGEDPYFGWYDSTSSAIDAILFDNPNYLSVWSAGNDRNDNFTNVAGNDQFLAFFSTPPANYHSHEGGNWYVVSPATGHPVPSSDGNNGTGYDSLPNGGQTAKNTLVVGAMDDHLVDPHNGGTMTITSFSSFGGTDDGRLGVDVVGNGASLTSTWGTGDTAYATAQGTSMSAPNVTGTAALLHEHYPNLTGGAIPTAATQKGYLIHTATDVTNPAANAHPGPDYATGYGMVNGLAAADFLSGATAGGGSDHLFENILIDSTTFSLSNWVATDDEIKVTLVWTDPAGPAQPVALDNRTPVLVNNLDLWLTDADNTIYYPWVLDIENPADAATTGINNVDVVEQVFLSGISAGSLWNVHVGHQGSLLGGFQNYSLLISGLMVPEPASLLLLALGALAVALRRPRRQRSAPLT